MLNIIINNEREQIHNYPLENDDYLEDIIIILYVFPELRKVKIPELYCLISAIIGFRDNLILKLFPGAISVKIEASSNCNSC